MSKNRELMKNTIMIFIGKFCTQFVTILLLPIYTKLLATEDYGFIDLIQTYLTLLIPIIFLKIDAGVFRFLIDYRENEEEKQRIITTTIVCFIKQVIICTIIFFLIEFFIDIKYSVLIYINLVTLGFVQLILQITRGIGKTNTYSISSMLSAVVTIILNIIFLIILKTDGKGILIASSVANIASSSFLIIKNELYKYIKIKKYEKDIKTEIIKYSIPMIPNELSWWIVHGSDRTIISLIIGVAANGIYSISCKFSSILSSIFSIFNMSWQEAASVHIKDQDKDEFFTDIINRVFNMFVAICLLIIVIIPFAFDIIIGEKYNEAYRYIPILLSSNIFYVLIGLLGGIYVAKKMTKEVSKTTIISAIINIVFHVILIKFIGLYAAAISTLISYVSLAIYRYKDIQKYAKINIPRITFIRTIIILTVTMFFYYKNILLWNIINFIVVLIFCIYINKDTICKFMKLGKNVLKKMDKYNGGKNV